MESRAMIVVCCWIALTIISVVYIWVGGVNIWTSIAVGLLVFTAFIITFAVGFGMPRDKKPEIEILRELSNIKSKLDDLTKEVEEIKKAIEE